MKPADKVMFNIFNIFKDSPLSMSDGLLISLQLLTWAALSDRGVLSEEDRIQSKESLTSEELNRIWDRLGAQLGDHGKAFSSWKVPEWLSPQVLGAATHLCQRASAIGVIPGLSLTDAVALLDGAKGELGAIPPAVADFMVALAGVRNGESVYLPWDSTAQLLGRVAEISGETYLESPLASPVPYLVGLLQAHQSKIQITDPITQPGAVAAGTLRQFDVVLSFPPIGTKYSAAQVADDWYRRFPEKTQSGTVLAIRHILAQMKGRAVVAVPNSVLFSSGAERSLRQDLLSERVVEAVITLPAGLLSSASFAFSILVLNKKTRCESVRLVDARPEEFRESDKLVGRFLVKADDILRLATSTDESDFAVTVSADEILENDAQLQPARYVLSPSQRKLQKWCSETPIMPLADVVETIRPMPTSSLEEGMVAYEVGVSDLPPFGHIQQPAKMVWIDPSVARKSSQQLLKSGDIVLIIKGSVGKLGIVGEINVPEGELGWIAGQSSIVLRSRKIEPRYLAMYLRSEIGQALMGRLVSDATISLLRLTDLMKLPVPVPSKEQQARVIEDFEQELRLQAQIESLRRQQSELASRHWQLQ